MSFLKVIGAPEIQMAEHAEEAAKSLRKAMKGFGTDESRIIRELVSNKNAVRQIIKKQYLTMFGKDLEDELKSEISGKFLDGVLAFLEPTDEYEARLLKKAIKGMGTDEKICIQILCSKEAHEIEILRAAYKRVIEKDLEKDMAREEGGPLGRIFRSIASAGRAENTGVDADLAKSDAQELYDAGEGKFGTDESKFIQILCSRSFQQLNATFGAYEQIGGNSIEKAIKKEMSGDLEDACLTIAKCAKNKPAYFAEKMHEAMKGMGTKDQDLIRLLVVRSEYDLPEIKREYERLYGKSLYSAVKSELSGDYEKFFLAIIGKD